jgi:thioester reductase-like protein
MDAGDVFSLVRAHNMLIAGYKLQGSAGKYHWTEEEALERAKAAAAQIKP